MSLNPLLREINAVYKAIIIVIYDKADEKSIFAIEINESLFDKLT